MRPNASSAARAWWRRLGSGLVSWLCCGPALTAQAPAPLPTAPAPRERIDTVLRGLDEHFARGDVAGYAATFRPDHPGCHALMRLQLERLVAATPQRDRTSTILTEPCQIGPRTVVRVRHAITLREPGTRTPRAELRQDAVVAFATAPDGSVVPTFCVEMPVDSTRNPEPQRPLRCPPCNYEVGGVAGWLCVPMHAEQANALEGASLFLIGTDLACDVSVEVEPEPQRATLVASDLGAALRSLEPTARLHPAEPWQPPAHRDQTGAPIDGARLEVELPDDFPQAGGGRALFHVTTFGGLQHLLLVRGSAHALRQHEGAVQALLASYRVLQRDGQAAAAASEALGHHTGGVCVGSSYRNELYRVVLDGPTGWKLQQRTGGPVFRVVWTSPAGSRLWLTAHRVPTGAERWTTADADLWIEQLSSQQNLLARPADTGTEWTPLVDCGAHARSLQLVPKAGPAEARPRVVRALRFDDLLLVADGFAVDDAEQAELTAALASLRRNP